MLKDDMYERLVDWQLVLTGMHRRNAADCAIRTFKKHFKAGLATTDESTPIHLWYRLLPQASTALNLTRKSRMNPKMSVEAGLN